MSRHFGGELCTLSQRDVFSGFYVLFLTANYGLGLPFTFNCVFGSARLLRKILGAFRNGAGKQMVAPFIDRQKARLEGEVGVLVSSLDIQYVCSRVLLCMKFVINSSFVLGLLFPCESCD